MYDCSASSLFSPSFPSLSSLKISHTTVLRKAGVSCPVGFFSHTPWPTSEIFRILPVRDKVLTGLLDCDLIGFQTYHDCRHFLSACTRVLSLDSQPKVHSHLFSLFLSLCLFLSLLTSFLFSLFSLPSQGVEFHGHTVAVDIFPTGVDPQLLEDVLKQPHVQERVAALRRMFPGKILVGRDRLDPIKGISLSVCVCLVVFSPLLCVLCEHM